MKINNDIRTSDSIDNLVKPQETTPKEIAQPAPAAAQTANTSTVDLNTRLREQSTKSRTSFDSQQVQESITRGLTDNFSFSRKDARFSQNLANSFLPKDTRIKVVQSGLTMARQITPSRNISVSVPRTISNGDFANKSKEFRNTLTSVRQLESQLKALEQQGGNPADIARVRGQFQAAENQLKSKYGYSAATAPKAGAVWVDPQFMSGNLTNGQINASKFPTKTPVTQPPDPTSMLFRNGKSITLKSADGKDVKISTPAQYKEYVSAQRAAAGMPVNGGDPIGVHLALEGGGGKGKRYNPAFATLHEQGIVPTSVSGSSAGAIAASLVAAGADPKQVEAFTKDDRIKNLFDVGFGGGGGVFNGNAAFDLIDQKLREITGIKDRPVTFADLPMPAQIIAAVYNDNQLPPGKTDLTKVENRIFVFSQETTPDTPVALAVRASMAIPGVYDAVEMIDPVTGREVELVDGGVLDNLPIGYNKNNLPTLAINLTSPNTSHPKDGDNTAKPKPLDGGQINPGNPISSGLAALKMMKAAANGAQNYKESVTPNPNTFVLNMPVFNLNNPKEGNSTLKFGYDNNLDPTLDRQSRTVTLNFLKQFMDDMKVPGARGSNLKPLPASINFNRTIQLNGQSYQASYTGGDSVNFTTNGKQIRVPVGKMQIENWYIDDQAFNDLPVRLTMALRDYLD